MSMEDRFEEAKKMIMDVIAHNKDIFGELSFNRSLVELSREILRPITQLDLREEIVWLSNVRHAAGNLDNAINQLERDINKGDEKKYKIDEQVI